MGESSSTQRTVGRGTKRRTRAAMVLCLAALLTATAVVAPGALQVGPMRTVSAAATTTAPDCNGNGVPDVNESSWSYRDDDGDGLCNAVDACPYEANPANSTAACQMQAITVPADPADPSVAHVTYSGAQITLKGIARYGGTQYRWDFGDGSSPSAWAGIVSSFDLGIKHAYTGTAGQTFTATLSVGSGPLGSPTSVTTATYPVQIVKTGAPDPTDRGWVDLRAQMASDEGLWYLHTHEIRGQYADGSPYYAQPYGFWNTSSFIVDDTCVVGDAFEQRGSLPAGSYDTDPYVDDVRRVLNFILTNSVVTGIGTQNYGNPDVNGNGLGIAVGGGRDGSGIGAAASCLATLADAATPRRLAMTGPAHVYGRSFADIGQDAVDWFAWAQNESGISRGNWGYQANDELSFVDAGYAGLPPLALGDAEAELGATVPAFVRAELPYWLAATRNTSQSSDNGSWGDSAPTNYVTAASAGAGMLAEEFLGETSSAEEMGAATGFLYRHWLDSNGGPWNCWSANLGDTRAMFPISLALLGAGSSRVTEWNLNTKQPTANSFDWFYTPAGQAQPGYAGNLINRQSADGSWSDNSGCNLNSTVVATAEGAMILGEAAPAILHLNHAPTWQGATPAAGAILDATPGSPISIDVAASDEDAGDVVTLTASAPSDATFTTSAANSATGTLTWTPSATGSTAITFTATDSHGAAVTRSITVNATKKSPTIDWATPASIVYGTALDTTQLNATLSAAAETATPPHGGSFTYTPKAGTILDAGDNTLSVTWDPDPADAAGWNSVTATLTLHVNKATQTLSFTPAVDNSAVHTYGDAPFSVTATSDAGLPVTYSVGAADACTSTPQGDGSTVITITGAGACTLSADQAGNADYSAAATLSHSFTVAKKTPSIGLNPADTTYGVPLDATQLDAIVTPADAGLNGTIGYTVDGHALPVGGILPAGTHTLTATYTPDADTGGNYNATSATSTFTVAQAGQAVTFAALPDKTFGDDSFGVSATADSQLTVSFTSRTADVCSVTATGTVSLLHAGTCTVAADQAGDGNYLAAPTVTRSFTVAKASQAIDFTSPGDQTYLDPPVALSATGGDSGNPVTFGAGPAGVCSVDGSNLILDGAGDCTITASQVGNDDYRAAVDVPHVITIRKANPVITWSTPNQITYGTALDAGQLDAAVQPAIAGTFTYTLADGTTPAAGAVLHASDTAQTLRVTFTPTAPDEANFTSATGHTTVLVTKADQAIRWTDVPATKSYGDAPFTVSAQGGDSGNAVTFGAQPGSACTVDGSTVTITGAGACVLAADQAGNADFNAAPTSTRSVTLAKQTPSIGWPAPADIVYGTPLGNSVLDATVTPAEAAANGTLTYATDAGTAAAAGQVLHAGPHTVTATYTPASTGAGLNYTATTRTVTLNVQQATQQITGFAAIGTHTFGDSPLTMSATGGNSGKPVYFTVGVGSSCAVSGTNGATLSLTGAGTCTVVAHQDGTADYVSAPEVPQTFQILQAPQAINFAPLLDVHVGDSAITLTATGGGSGNPVTFAAGPAATCAATNTGVLTVLGPGTCTVTAYQAGNSNYLAAAPITRSFSVAYRTCVLSDQSQLHPAGSVVVVEVTICDAAGHSLANSAVVVHATSLDSGPASAPGGSQPGNNFRYTGRSGGSYQYNLATSGLPAGTHRLSFTVQGDPTTHAASVRIG